jgi:hypothetical protein
MAHRAFYGQIGLLQAKPRPPSFGGPRFRVRFEAEGAGEGDGSGGARPSWGSQARLHGPAYGPAMLASTPRSSTLAKYPMQR